ncbi:hypothetical protein GRI33_11950 [Brucella sp. BO3]|nr:hypothetical protein GRI33_11950 [Brucella sp. BO3]
MKGFAAACCTSASCFATDIGPVPVKTEPLEPLQVFVSSHFPTQNRFTLLLEMLQSGFLF